MISTLLLVVLTLIQRIYKYIKKVPTEENQAGELNKNVHDNNWAICLSITGCLTAATFSTLAATGILIWETAIALASPLVLVSIPFSFILLITRIISNFKPGKKITALGIGFCQYQSIEERMNNVLHKKDDFDQSEDIKVNKNNDEVTDDTK